MSTASRCPLEVLIYADAFDAQHEATRMKIIGREGITLADAWQEGNEAYLGTRFPDSNMLVMTGPTPARPQLSSLHHLKPATAAAHACLSLAKRNNSGRLRFCWLKSVWVGGSIRSQHEPQTPYHPRRTCLVRLLMLRVMPNLRGGASDYHKYGIVAPCRYLLSASTTRRRNFVA